MNSETREISSSRYYRKSCLIFLPLAVALATLPAGASRPMPPPMVSPMPQPRPEPPASHRFVCDTDVEAPASVRAAYEEYYQCVRPELEGWLEKHPASTPGLELLYDRWREARRHDLRDRADAGRWARRHSVDFSSQEVELTARQIDQLGPTIQGPPVAIPGLFQRIFVDRANQRLFLTSDREGLVSVSIADRYAFTLEGKVGMSGATDFFVVDDTTAFVEETVAEGGNRDLVVLDISNRSAPREVARLRGVIPAAGTVGTFTAGVAQNPPTFDHYLLIREGRLQTAKCGAPPVVSTHPGVICRPDGTCYRRELVNEPNDGFCERIPPAQRRVAMGRISRTTDGNWMDRESMRMEDSAAPRKRQSVRGSFGEAGMASPPMARSAPMMSAEMSAPAEAAAPMPEGGAGGAGSLSQMMMYGSTLYVLSGDHGHNEGWLTTFDVTRPRRPTVAHVIKLDNGPEALQRHDNLLLVAGRDALVTASLGLSTAPRVLGEYRQDCPVTFDPVVVQGSIAYRTIIVDQPSNACSSRLEVIELSQPHQPVLRATRALSRPRGLSVLGERLFIADESRGVHVFDLTDPVNPEAVGVLSLKTVNDLVLSGFDLYALAPDRVETFWVGPLFERGVDAKTGLERVRGFTTVERRDGVTLPPIEPGGDRASSETQRRGRTRTR